MANVAGDPPSYRRIASDEDLARLHVAYALTRDRTVRDRLLAHYDRMAVGIARKFSTRRETMEDLIQVARIGLIHAVERFDPARERPRPRQPMLRRISRSGTCSCRCFRRGRCGRREMYRESVPAPRGRDQGPARDPVAIRGFPENPDPT